MTYKKIKKHNQEYSLLEYIILSFIPFTGPNLDLTCRRGRFVSNIEKLTGSSQNSIRSTISRAYKEGYLRKIEDKENKLEITAKGKIKVLEYLLQSKKEKPEKWDKKWRVLIFDIPEGLKRKRDFFREKIQELGFCQFQKSVWVCPYDYTKELEMLIDELEIGDYVQYLIAQSLSGEDILKEYFKDLKI